LWYPNIRIPINQTIGLADGCKAGSTSTVGSTRLSLGLEVLIREALQQITPERFFWQKKGNHQVMRRLFSGAVMVII